VAQLGRPLPATPRRHGPDENFIDFVSLNIFRFYLKKRRHLFFRVVYLNVIVNVIKKLRGEAAEAAKQKPTTSSASVSSFAGPKQPNLVTTHLQVLAGKPGTVGTWSIEKKSAPKLVTKVV
jgi:hypothetical protein